MDRQLVPFHHFGNLEMHIMIRFGEPIGNIERQKLVC
jgi:hypothetical protein